MFLSNHVIVLCLFVIIGNKTLIGLIGLMCPDFTTNSGSAPREWSRRGDHIAVLETSVEISPISPLSVLFMIMSIAMLNHLCIEECKLAFAAKASLRSWCDNSHRIAIFLKNLSCTEKNCKKLLDKYCNRLQYISYSRKIREWKLQLIWEINGFTKNSLHSSIRCSVWFHFAHYEILYFLLSDATGCFQYFFII